MREQGWSGLAMLSYRKLQYSGFRNTVENHAEQFPFTRKAKAAARDQKAGTK